MVNHSPVAQPSVEVAQQAPSVEQPQQPGASYYAPAGTITVVGAEQPGQINKPVASGPVRSVEQYGQPESAALPPNYKPFGSWGLYIGGNPADGYYTNYYKALSNSVEKQQNEALKPVGPVSSTAALSPILRQAGSSPYVGGDFYPFAYSTADFNSGRISMEPAHPGVYSSGFPLSPVQAGAQVYGSPLSYDSGYPTVSSYAADSYATKKLGVAYAQKEAPKEAQVSVAQPASQQSKGYQSRVYVYPSVVAASPVAPVQAVSPASHHNQPQVVAYPVPVGSQIVGSQPGVEGSFNPYGVHAFTRYAIKPAVVSQADQAYHYGVQSGQSQQLPAYKQQVYQPSHAYGNSYYPLSYYGFPLSQLHYSHGSIVPASFSEAHHSVVQVVPVDSVPKKVDGVVENEELVNKPQ